MHTRNFGPLAALLILAGCSYSGMDSSTLDPVTGKWTTVHYSRLYEVIQNLPEQQAKVVLVADALKKNAPVVHELQTSIGALGPSDLYAHATFFAIVTNYSSSPLRFRVMELSYRKEHAITNEASQSVPAGHQEKVQLGFCTVDSYATNLVVHFDFAVNEERRETNLDLQRLTYEELEQRRRKTNR